MTTPSPQQDLTYLTNEEAAARLRISPGTLERMRTKGTGPRFCKAGPGKRSRVLYHPADVEAWLQKFSFQAVSEYSKGDQA